MPNNVFLKKYYEQLMAANEGMAYSDEYREYLEAIDSLVKIFEPFETKKEGKYPPLDIADVKKIQEGYSKIFEKGRAFLKASEKDTASKDKTLKTRIALVRNAEEKITESSMAFAGAAGAVGMTIPEIMDTIRGREIKVDKKDIHTVGAASSTRIPIKFKTEGGKEVEGFFTEYTSRNYKREKDELVNRLSKGNKNLKNIFDTLFSDYDFLYDFKGGFNKEKLIIKQINNSKQEEKYKLAHVLARVYSKFDRNKPYDVPDSIMQKLEPIFDKTNAPDLNERIVTFLREASTIYHKNNVAVSGVQMVGKNKIEDRNVAMTSVADLLGCSGLIAKSTKMNILVNGQRREGVFMEKAEGEDLSGITKYSPLSQIEDKDVSPEFYSQLADLQILDFICGNVDRHLLNVMYKTENKIVDGNEKIILSGVMGIDNDSSCGIIDGTVDNDRLPSVGNLKAINKSMAERVSMMTPELLELALKPCHLDKKEVEAAKKRLKLVQKAILGKKIEVIPNDGWKNIDPFSFAVFEEQADKKKRSVNYFALFRNMGTRFGVEANRSEKDRSEKMKIRKTFEKTHPFYKLPEKTEASAAKGERVGEMELQGFNNAYFAHLQQKIQMASCLTGTSEYTNLSKQLKTVIQKAKKVNAESDILDWMKLKDSYKKLLTDVNKYIDRKEAEKVKLDKKGKKPSSIAQKREMAMTSLRNFLQSREAAVGNYINDLLGKKVNIDAIRNEVEQIETKGKNGKVSSDMLRKLFVKKQILSEMEGGNTDISKGAEYNGMVRLRKTDAFKEVRKEYRKGELDLSSAKHSLEEKLFSAGITMESMLRPKQPQPPQIDAPEIKAPEIKNPENNVPKIN